MPRFTPAMLLVLGLATCSSSPPSPPTPGDPASPATVVDPSDQASPVAPEDPNGAMPTAPRALAERLATTTVDLDAAVAAWRAGGDTGTWPPPDDVVLLALDQQRIYQALAGRKALRRRAIARLPGDLRKEARTLAGAGARLASGARPVTKTPRLRTIEPLAADALRTYYDEAEARFGVGWELLAAVHFIETRFGRVVSNSTAGAQGPMQFIPSTWQAYGLGGDIHEPRDAILGAANYLSASGALQNERQALLAYNPVDNYADAVGLYADQMRRDPDSFYALFNWQVFVRTPAGDLKRLTGPGT